MNLIQERTGGRPVGAPQSIGMSVRSGACGRLPGRRAHGFTLIELTIVVAILGVLAGFAIQVYVGAAIKAHIADALTVVSPMKMTVFDNLTMGTSDACDGIDGISTPINSVVSANCTDLDGEVRVHVVMDKTAGDLILDFVSDRTGSTQWRCVAAPEFVDFAYLPGNCQ